MNATGCPRVTLNRRHLTRHVFDKIKSNLSAEARRAHKVFYPRARALMLHLFKKTLAPTLPVRYRLS